MDGSKADGGKAVQVAQSAAAGSDAGEDAAKPLDAPVAAGEEVDDEQVERFYALLANIRAMRSAYTPGGGETAAGDDGGVRKRLRSAESPWRPAFRLEDFEVEVTSTSRCVKKERSQPDGVASPSLPQPQPQPRTGARRFDSESKSI